jgi:two-component system, cell cycle sensor histidine kinase and response regulator CckA
MNEAARRSGLQLEWVYSPEGPDVALDTGQVDLWPIIGDFPERKGHVYVSAPWTIRDYGLISRKNDPIAGGSKSSDLIVASLGKWIEDRLARQEFPNAKFYAVDSVEEQMSAVCSGKAEVAVVAQTLSFDQSTLPDECRDVALQMAVPPGLSIRFGVGASYVRPGAVEAANVLQNTLGEMTKDGSLESTEFQLLDSSLSQTRSAFDVIAAERRERFLEGVPILLGAILIVLVWLVIERKRAERTLSEERRLLRTLIDNVPDRIYVKDAKSRWVAANRSLAEHMGAKGPEELLGKTDFDFFPKEIATAFFSREQAILQSGQAIVDQEERTLDAEGNAKWVSTSKVPWRDTLGHVIGIMGIGRDITERKTAEDALRETNQALKALVHASPAAIVCVDREGKITIWNPAAERMFGWQEDELLGQSIPMVPDLDRNVFYDFRSAQLRGESMWNQEVRAPRKDGSSLEIIVSLAPLRDDEGELRGAMYVALDITARKAAEAQLRLHAAALESAANSVVISDKAGRILWVNPAFTALTGYSTEEAVGQTLDMLNSGRQPESFFEQLRKTISSGEVWHGEIINRRKDGSLYTEQQTVTPVCGEKGEILHFVTIQQDITETKALALQLNQAQKMESVGRLAGGVAHDFNNLLSVIIGYSDVLLGDSGLDARTQKHAEEIKKAGNRAAALTRQLLAFSRQQVLEPKVLKLNSIVVETERMLRRLIGEDIELETKLAPNLGAVKADPGQMGQIVMNLAVNARDAMPNGGKLTIATGDAELDEEYAWRHVPCVPGLYVTLTVTDTGIGMDAETKAHIFEPFFTTKELGKGTGLGLSTVYGIVKQSGGYIWVYSEPGQGSVFKIYLPRVDQPVRHVQTSELTPGTLSGSETILVVEDDESVRALICSMLAQSGYVVLEAKDAADGLEIARQRKSIDLLLTDVVMPVMNGPAMARKLEEIIPEMRVLYMSGYAGSFAVDRGILDEGASFLQKPFSKSALLQRLRETLDVQPAVKRV